MNSAIISVDWEVGDEKIVNVREIEIEYTTRLVDHSHPLDIIPRWGVEIVDFMVIRAYDENGAEIPEDYMEDVKSVASSSEYYPDCSIREKIAEIANDELTKI